VSTSRVFGHRYGNDDNYHRLMKAAREARVELNTFSAFDLDELLRPGGIVRVKRRERDWTVPNRLYGTTLTDEGEAI
jgi:hypothetical protein